METAKPMPTNTAIRSGRTLELIAFGPDDLEIDSFKIGTTPLTLEELHLLSIWVIEHWKAGNQIDCEDNDQSLPPMLNTFVTGKLETPIERKEIRN